MFYNNLISWRLILKMHYNLDRLKLVEAHNALALKIKNRSIQIILKPDKQPI